MHATLYPMHQTQRNQKAQRLGGRTVSDLLIHIGASFCCLLQSHGSGIQPFVMSQKWAVRPWTLAGCLFTMWDLRVALPHILPTVEGTKKIKLSIFAINKEQNISGVRLNLRMW